MVSAAKTPKNAMMAIRSEETCGYGNITCTSCSSSCTVQSQEGTYCGDGEVQEAFEVCDPNAGPQNCADVSSVFLDATVANCKNDCSGWNTGTCVPDNLDAENGTGLCGALFKRL